MSQSSTLGAVITALNRSLSSFSCSFLASRIFLACKSPTHLISHLSTSQFFGFCILIVKENTETNLSCVHLLHVLHIFLNFLAYNSTTMLCRLLLFLFFKPKVLSSTNFSTFFISFLDISLFFGGMMGRVSSQYTLFVLLNRFPPIFFIKKCIGFLLSKIA